MEFGGAIIAVTGGATATRDVVDWIYFALQILTGVGGLVTVGLAVLVFQEAKAIRAANWVSNQNAGWNAFNDTIIQNEGQYRALEEIFGADGTDLGLCEKQLRLLFEKMNLLEADFRAAASGKFSDSLGGHHVLAVLKRVAPDKREPMARFMQNAGYDPAFVRFARFCFLAPTLVTELNVHTMASIAVMGKIRRRLLSKTKKADPRNSASYDKLAGLLPF